MRLIRLNGELGKRFGRIHKMDVKTPAEAIRALAANHPGFQQFLIESGERGLGYRCVVDKGTIGEQELAYPMSRSFSITPVVTGAGKIGQIILGIVLIVAAFYTFGVAGGFGLVAEGATMATATIGFLGLTYANVAWLGVALVLGGVAQMLAPTPKAAKAGEKQENQYFDGPTNTTAQGAAVPVGYGRMIVGSAVISAAITVEDKSPYLFPYDYPIFGYSIP